MSDDNQRLRDPIHGLILFDKENKIDMLAWQLIQTPEFQRLRRIRQLGVSEFVFPSATHTRFSHSIGVYNNARKLMNVVESHIGKEDFSASRAEVVLIAALLHDIGHGPFSHAFEGARIELAKARKSPPIENHEKYTAKIISAKDGEIRKILDAHNEALAENIAQLIAAEDPIDIYHAVVSSSFDADRLDYLMRDRYMTGTGAGSIDYDWLIDNLTICSINLQQDDDEPRQIPTFVFKWKGRQAAEDFLLARYRLYSQVYLHKTTRGFEKLITALILRIGKFTDDPSVLGLSPNHPLIQFLSLGGDTLENYRLLDDSVVWSVIEQLQKSPDSLVQSYAKRLWNRLPLKVLDVSAEFGHDNESYNNALHHLDTAFTENLNETVFKDLVPYNLYSRSQGKPEKAHKMVRVLRPADGKPKEITEFSDTLIGVNHTKKESLMRYYFLTSDERANALKIAKGR